jgi:hypothetical protein
MEPLNAPAPPMRLAVVGERPPALLLPLTPSVPAAPRAA